MFFHNSPIYYFQYIHRKKYFAIFLFLNIRWLKWFFFLVLHRRHLVLGRHQVSVGSSPSGSGRPSSPPSCTSTPLRSLARVFVLRLYLDGRKKQRGSAQIRREPAELIELVLGRLRTAPCIILSTFKANYTVVCKSKKNHFEKTAVCMKVKKKKKKV